MTTGHYKANFRPRKLPNAIGRTAKNLFINSVWAGAASGTPGTVPTGWGAPSGLGGTTTVYPSSFLGGNALGFSASSNRQYISVATATITPGTFCLSVHVTTVVGVAPNQILLAVVNTITPTFVGYYFDGVAINASTALANGISGVLSVVYTVSATGSVSVRAGIGASGNGTGEVILDLPQFEAGSTRTGYEPTYGQLPPYFLRNSDGTDTSVKGILSTKGVNVPAFDGKDGLILEAQATNLVSRSSDIAAWTKSAIAVTNAAVPIPLWGESASLLVENTSTATHEVAIGTTIAANTNVAISVYVKRVTGSRDVRITYGNLRAIYNLSTLAVTNGTFGDGVYVSGSATLVSDGWIRITLIGVPSAASANSTLYIGPVLGGTSTVSYAGDGESSLAIWGVQIEAGSFPTSYIPTTTAAVTRNAAYIGNILPLSELGLVSKTNDYSIHFAVKMPASSTVMTSGTFATLRGAIGTERVRVFINGAGVIRFAKVSSLGNVSVDVSGLTWAAGDVLNIRARISTDGVLIYVGASSANNTTTNSKNGWSQAIDGFILNGTESATVGVNGTYLGFQAWDRALSDAELEALSADDFLYPEESGYPRFFGRSRSRKAARRRHRSR
jgi:hypothetical protein